MCLDALSKVGRSQGHPSVSRYGSWKPEAQTSSNFSAHTNGGAAALNAGQGQSVSCSCHHVMISPLAVNRPR